VAAMFRALKNERFFEQVAGSIQREILLGHLKPGEKLPNEAELARQFNVGRSAIREALKVLELTGLLYVKRGYNGGTFVRPPDPADAFATPAFIASTATGWEQLVEARRLIEVETARLAATRRADDEVLMLGHELERMREVTAVPARFIDEDVTFHLRIAEAAKNEVFFAVINSLRTPFKKETNQIISQYGAVEEILGQHQAIHEMIAARDPDGAAREMARHLDSLGERMTSLSAE
jgi:GntR family transcriptional repressor for pyruvate dehydrogenase complex